MSLSTIASQRALISSVVAPTGFDVITEGLPVRDLGWQPELIIGIDRLSPVTRTACPYRRTRNGRNDDQTSLFSIVTVPESTPGIDLDWSGTSYARRPAV